ncbi:tastin [Anolis carolinensis]|uniref:tastin n=1 Tax=Anolis carolinensis TaxID=28377 RepID=UPI000462C204|nr:PREDICTED: tastin [Anolis carolinensis]XP_008112616.1 PREDICTED: tastin [Anolis carolinensis]|eukprot:XP_008112615.1 PREDICTED: tastin [Anolis carolinensis]
MAHIGKENQQEAVPLPERASKESAVLAANAFSSKIPVLSKSRLAPKQQTCVSSGKSKAIKDPKVPHTSSAPAVGGLEPVAASLPKSLSREPLGEVHLSTSGHRNEGNRSAAKRVGNSGGEGTDTEEFVPDVAALASILSNTGLKCQMMNSTHKPSLAQRVPLSGNRACSASIGTARGSLYTKVSEGNPVRFSCISRSTSKDTDLSKSCGLSLNIEQLKTLSSSLKNYGPRGEVTQSRHPAEDQRVTKFADPAAKPIAECLSRVTPTDVPVQSNSAGTKDATGSSWKDEEFVPDSAAKASILSNEGLSRFAIGANGKLSMAQRVLVKCPQKTPVTCGNTRGESDFFLERRTRASSIGKFGRVPYRSPQGLQGLKQSAASGAQPTNTPGNRFTSVGCSSYTPARRVPQSLCRTPWTFRRGPLSFSHKNMKVGIQPPAEMEQGKIAMRLFDDEVEASAKKVPAASMITPEMGKLQCVELLAQLLCREMNNGDVDQVVAPSLKELHNLLSAHCSPALEPAQPASLSTPSQDPTPNFCKPTALPEVVVAPETSTTLATTSSQQLSCPGSCMPLAQHPSSSASRSDQLKQRLADLRNAPQRFHEALLNDECAFYTARVTSVSQSSVPRCKEPVAKTLEAHGAMHFIPIAAPLSPLGEGESPATS